MLAKVVPQRAAVTPYAVAGPHLDFLIGRRPRGELTLVDDYATLAFGAIVGVGAEARELVPVPLFIEIRFSFDVSNSMPGTWRDAYNNAIELLLGIKL